MDNGLVLGIPFDLPDLWEPGRLLYTWAGCHTQEMFEFEYDASVCAEELCWCQRDYSDMERLLDSNTAYRFIPNLTPVLRFDPNKGLVLNTSCPACHGEDPGCPMCHPPKKD